MAFSVGDKIIHPKFGAGRITGEAHRELVEGFQHYYVIDVISTGATAYVPMRKMDDLGVRQVMSEAKLSQVFMTLQSIPRILSNDYKQRQARVQEQLQTRRPITVAKVVRDLTWRRERKRLTQKDESLLNQGRELLASEMALATDTEISDAQQTIDIALSDALSSESDTQVGLEGAGANPTVTPEALVQRLVGGLDGDPGVPTYASA